jgi:catalase
MVGGEKVRQRSATFADHYSQARQFFVSQTEIERDHIVMAFVFELSKVKKEAIRTRMLANLVNVDRGLAQHIAEGLNMPLPPATHPARPVLDLPPSPALSILLNGPTSFAGRTLGVLVGDGADVSLLKTLRERVATEGGQVCIVGPRVGGVTLSDGSTLRADEKVEGGPSVLFDACAVLVSEDSAATLSRNLAAREWVALAFAHMKRVAYVPAAAPLLAKAGVTGSDLDAGFTLIQSTEHIAAFLKTAHQRYWPREETMSG